MKYYFAYGSNLCRRLMLQHCPEHKIIGLGILRDYRWIIAATTYANVVKSPGDEVQGLVYQITASDEATMDVYEEIREDLYRKEVLPVEVGGKVLDCMLYVSSLTDEGKPDADYAAVIKEGAADARLPLEYVKRYISRFVP